MEDTPSQNSDCSCNICGCYSCQGSECTCKGCGCDYFSDDDDAEITVALNYDHRLVDVSISEYGSKTQVYIELDLAGVEAIISQLTQAKLDLENWNKSYKKEALM